MADESEPSEVEVGAAERLIFFSDAVVAIALTLLALELPVPTGKTTREFWSSVGDNGGEYIAFFVSFVVIALHWSAHHRAFRYLRQSDDRLRNLNTLWLLAIVLLPFATKLISDETGDQTRALRWGFYALLQVLAYGTFLVMVRYMVTKRFVVDEMPANFVSRMDWGLGSVVVGFAMSIPLFIVTRYAWITWIAAPVAADVLRGRMPSRRRRVTGDVS